MFVCVCVCVVGREGGCKCGSSGDGVWRRGVTTKRRRRKEEEEG